MENIKLTKWLVGLAGVVIGCISAVAAAFFSTYGLIFAPGFLFGLMVGFVYFVNSEQEQVNMVRAGAVVVAGVICYQIAFWPTFWVTAPYFVGNMAFIIVPFVTVVGGFFATLSFIGCLHILTNEYRSIVLKFSIYGGLTGAILINSVTYVLINYAALPNRALIFMGYSIFFIGWQTIMLLLITDPLLRKPDDQSVVSTPAIPQR